MIDNNASMQNQAYEIIKNKILMAVYYPGQRVSEKSVVTDLGIGRTPVREALLHLRRDNLIRVAPQSGTFISLIDLHAATEARFIRENLEKMVVLQATNQITSTQIDHLDAILQRQQLEIKLHNVTGFFETDEQFHQFFYQVADKNLVWDWLQDINIQLNRFRWLRLKINELDWESLTKDHQQILAAIKNKDAQRASELAGNHLHLMLEERATLLAHFPNYFEGVHRPN